MGIFRKKFCTKCGERLVWKEQVSCIGDKFDAHTGKPKKPDTFLVGQCPKYACIYEYNSVYPNGHSLEFA